MVEGPRAFDWPTHLLSVVQTGFHRPTIVELGASQGIWQSKTPLHLQGRVFSALIPIGQIGEAVGIPIARSKH